MNNRVFKISPAIIWVSSLFIGVLASIPKLLRLNFSALELGVDISIASFFSLFVWYYNLHTLPNFQSKPLPLPFVNKRLIRSLLLGLLCMGLLVIFHQLLFPYYHFQSMMLMYEFRGLVINLTVYLFLHLLYQGYTTQVISLELERIKADQLNAQFTLLKQQVNPHFLFNSLNTLKSMVEIQDKNATDFIVKLSDFYRSSLENRKKSLVPATEEIGVLQDYMFLLKARFEEGIQLEVHLSPGHLRSYIPVFTLQLLAENSIKHNILSLEHPLYIKICSEEDWIIVQNNLQLKRSPESSTHTGLENINERYRHLVKKEIIISEDTHFFTVKLPVINESEQPF
ncbi:MAG TPA: histidine kinase [Puia sp.]